MTASHWNVLSIYLGFTLIATLLALARRWLRPGTDGESLWRKYPTYILINLGFLAASWSPPTWHILTALLSLLGGLAAWEIARALFQAQKTSISFSAILLPCMTFALIVLAGWLEMTVWFKVWLILVLLLTAMNTITGAPGDYGQRILALSGCVFYLPICLAAYLWIHQSDPTGFRAAFLYLTIATNDALAQITGQLFGARPLAPHISPAKTVEGAIGGVLFAGAMGYALSSTVGWSYSFGAISGILLGMAGLIGDLTASVWKRALGLKNFGELLGAQGGILDRFDGLIFAAPVFYLLIVV